MAKTIKTKDTSLEICLFDAGRVEIESNKFKDVSIQVKLADPTHPLTPPGALWRIELYQSKKHVKNKPFEYDSAWVMSDGTILKRGKEYLEYMRKHES